MESLKSKILISLKILIYLVGAFSTVFFGAPSVLAQVCAYPGKDNPAVVSGVVNTYYPSPTSANASGTSIPVGAVNNAESALTPITAGDLLLIIQMQDATINTKNNSNYGSNSGTGNGFTSGNVGYYEYVIAANSVSTSGGTITTTTSLSMTYRSSNPGGSRGKQTYQVVRVPQYSSVTISGTVSAAAWDGTSGGIIVLDIAGTLNMSGGTISAAGKGFRGGLGRSLSGGSGSNSDYRMNSTNQNGASKGEGIVGTPRYVWDEFTGIDTGVEGYPSGSYARGAPGNAGGGGNDGNPSSNDENSGGGGGGNGGEGGSGGNSWSSNLSIGGVGGGAFPSSADRLTMGGGGGAGTTNNGAETTSSGASGGGIVMIRTGTVTGSGTIDASGSNAQNSSPSCCGDGAGGGGAGGSIILTAVNSAGISGITALARGGKGGNTLLATSPHGPGGGGGGGAVFSSGSFGSTNVSGGASGTTSSGSAYNAQSGSAGTINSIAINSIPGVSSGAQCVPVLTVTKSTSTPTVTNPLTGTTASYTITVSNAANRVAATEVSISDLLPQPVTNGFTYSSLGTITLGGGTSRTSISNPVSGATNPAWGNFTIPAGGNVAITFIVAIASNVPSATYQNPATATYFDPARTIPNGTTSASYNSASSTNEDITVTSRPNITLTKSCPSPADCETVSQMPGTDLTFQIQFTNNGGQSAANIVIVDAIPLNMDYKVGTASVAVGTSGLTFAIEFSNDYNAASPSLATWTYTPVSAGGGASTGYNRNVKAIRWRVTAGVLSYGSPNNTGNVSFVAKIR